MHRANCSSIPYIQQTRKELGLADDHPALAIFDVHIFKGQTTEALYDILEQNNIFVIKIPANCTDWLQPMNLSINKAVKDFMRRKPILRNASAFRETSLCCSLINYLKWKQLSC